MGLIEQLAAPPQHRPGKSIMDVWVDSRPDVEQSAILTAVVDPAWGHVALMDVLTIEGAPKMSDTAFRAWRKKRGLK